MGEDLNPEFALPPNFGHVTIGPCPVYVPCALDLIRELGLADDRPAGFDGPVRMQADVTVSLLHSQDNCWVAFIRTRPTGPDGSQLQQQQRSGTSSRRHGSGHTSADVVVDTTLKNNSRPPRPLN